MKIELKQIKQPKMHYQKQQLLPYSLPPFCQSYPNTFFTLSNNILGAKAE